jgi:DNA (cytosine-5)-methyltransferase 1
MPEKNRFPAVLQPVCITGQVTHTLKAEGFDASEDGTGRGQPIVPAYDFNARQDPDSRQERTGPLDTDGGTQAIAFSCKDHGGDAGPISPTLRAMGGNVPNGGGQVAVAFQPSIALQTDVTPKASVELAFTLKLPSVSGGGQPAAVMTPAMQVRRLTPVECERLQGFPDNWTLIPWRKKPASECPDGPRYKALGNSMAVPVVRWIGQRIAAHAGSITG